MKKHEFSFSSATGTCAISACGYSPEGNPSAILVIHHGMAEHRERYLPFVQFLTDNHFAVYMHDMANHGKSNHDPSEKGWFGEKDGWKALVEDFRTLTQRAAKEFPEIPLYVMGHSMGSFICRAYCAIYEEEQISGAIFMGTGGPNPATPAGMAAASLIGLVKGKKYRSKGMDKLAFGAYNKRFEGRTSYDWLTRDHAIVDQYIADPNCGFLFTVQGMHDLVSVNAWVNSDDWYKKIPAALPILLISGNEDPVGNYGSGVKAVAERLHNTGHIRVTVRLYPDARHEILNETNKDEVMSDILSWLRKT